MWEFILGHLVLTISVVAICVAIVLFFLIWRYRYPVSWHVWHLENSDLAYKDEEALVSLAKTNEFVIPAVIEFLKTHDDDVRSRAVRILSNIGRNAVPPVIDLLSHSDYSIRYSACMILGNIKDPQAIKWVDIRVADNNQLVRRMAIEALGNIGSPLAVGCVKKVLMDDREDAILRLYAAKSLKRIGWVPENLEEKLTFSGILGDWKTLVDLGSPAIPEINKILMTSRVCGDRESAARALGEIKDKIAIPDLIKALDDDFDDVRRVAAEALIGLNWRPETIKEKLSYYMAIGDWSTLTELGSPAVQALIRAAESNMHRIRESAIGALEAIVDPHATIQLIDALGHHSEYVRMAAATALDRFGHPRLKLFRDVFKNRPSNSRLRSLSKTEIEGLKDAFYNGNEKITFNLWEILPEVETVFEDSDGSSYGYDYRPDGIGSV